MKSLSLIFFTLTTIFLLATKAAADTSDPTDLISLFKDDQKAVRISLTRSLMTNSSASPGSQRSPSSI